MAVAEAAASPAALAGVLQRVLFTSSSVEGRKGPAIAAERKLLAAKRSSARR
jgi:hypothetical protein